ncbi:MAG: carboxypeptidase-like regulatory domain-containing protein, partial [Terracidiphilus sp.]
MSGFGFRFHTTANFSLSGSRLWKSFAICAALIAALLAFSPAARAQDNATVTGSVTDSTGAVIPNATVTITNTATGQVRSVTSNGVGTYR